VLSARCRHSKGLGRGSKGLAKTSTALDKKSIVSIAKNSTLGSADGHISVNIEDDEVPWHAIPDAEEVVQELVSNSTGVSHGTGMVVAVAMAAVALAPTSHATRTASTSGGSLYCYSKGCCQRSALTLSRSSRYSCKFDARQLLTWRFCCIDMLLSDGQLC
jgi:hypothetical protein